MSATQKLIELIEPYFQLNRPPHHTLSRMSLFSDGVMLFSDDVVLFADEVVLFSDDVVLFSDEVVLFPDGLQFSIG
ncbi:hypothetical protein [Yersinia pseudotuberculosis]|uniref:AraC family transcriptional regulator n=1 Tax=Yersinia pseudotuberculosis TaxID=633 RepID=A0ABN5R765_YERPU|nr:hypothetical protein [Yersinia pseudotuberculosis]AXY34242.1 hypothetical protein CEQ20_12980 [Yersinia pseudotuberculosis]AYW92082.1 hypothetical protein EGX47_12775 [Yersinia pseudotuberculosis]AYW96298.1 hypothetical protein EGX39_11100 [Yersinia pseudotuberculosis]AYX09913.1 hypothetical protein EGX52_03100 [Yersinia pseudotuberculosis]AYX17098.1 hypothetical protein EGX44_19250 [Yersinia pseudotuberculosis]